jgi:uncharacterized membrane protein YphA (DoxX/SURF4 family)
MSAFDRADDHRLGQWVLVRLVGVTFLIAFVSWWPQIDGLVGSKGLLPIAEYLRAVEKVVGQAAFDRVPTIFWVTSDDAFIRFVALAGIVFSVLLIIGFWPRMLLALLWFSYLSFMTTSRVFLSFQWDTLLLETALVTIVLAPGRLLPDWPGRMTAPAPSHMAVWLVRLLLFKLMFCSGVGKLFSGDPTWRDLTALSFHYETQPLPTWIAWYAHWLPLGFHKASAIVMFIVEIGVPFLMFMGRKPRMVCAVVTSALMITISLTGNYTYFNWLTIVLCASLVDDATLRRVFRLRRAGAGLESDGDLTAKARPRGREAVARGALAAFAALYIGVSVVLIASIVTGQRKWPKPIEVLVVVTDPFRSINRYGLFTVMSTTRPEIVIEGSEDGVRWRPYEFKWKPGDPSRRPVFVAPHQPRLDWQMWFAALGNYRSNPWLIRLMQRLLEGDPLATSMLRIDPFPDAPPRQVRAVRYNYRFSDPATRKDTGHWWVRESVALYAPILTATEK